MRYRLPRLRPDGCGELILSSPHLIERVAALVGIVERVDLDPDQLTCQIHYRVSVDDSLIMARPQGKAKVGLR